MRVVCPHQDDREQTVSGGTTLTGLCSSATVTVQKPLQKGTWDKGAESPDMLSAHPRPRRRAGYRGGHPGRGADPRRERAGAAGHAARSERGAHRPAGHAHRQGRAHHRAQLGRDGVPRLRPDDAHRRHRDRHPRRARGEPLGQGWRRRARGRGGRGRDRQGDDDPRRTRDAKFADDPGWNDLLFIAFTDSTPEKAQHVEVFECTIDAGVAESNLGRPHHPRGQALRRLSRQPPAQEVPGQRHLPAPLLRVLQPDGARPRVDQELPHLHQRRERQEHSGGLALLRRRAGSRASTCTSAWSRAR